jgi:hypothetical protein
MTLGNLVKPIFVVSILVFSIVGMGLIIQEVSADHGEDPGITKPVVIGTNILKFRDITNTDAQTSTITIDNSMAEQGILTITLEELDANLDVTEIEIVTVTANSTTSGAVKANVPLTETGVNTGIFTGQLILSTTETVDNKLQVSEGDVITYNHFEDSLGVAQSHSEESRGVGRFQAKLELTAGGNIKITDVLVPDDLGGNIIPRSHAVHLELLDGATLDPANPPIITLSYAHLDLGGEDPNLLSMYYDPGPVQKVQVIPGGQPVCNLVPGCVWDPITGIGTVTTVSDTFGWQEIRDPQTAIEASHDPITMTITSDIATSPYGLGGSQIFGPVAGFGVPSSGQFMLAFDKGSIGGGGGGGLVKPGFVVNALAGAQAFSSFFKSSSSGGAGGSSGAGPAPPLVLSGTLSILSGDDEGFGGIIDDTNSNSLEKSQKVIVGESLTFRYEIYENGGIDNLVHATMYFFDADENDASKHLDLSKSETYIMLNRGQPVQIVDPQGYFASADIEILEKDAWNLVVKYDITFAKPMPESHIMYRNWDSQRNSVDKVYPNAIEVLGNSFVQTENKNTQDTTSETAQPSLLDSQNENQLPEEKIVTKTGYPGIPFWVKNNAMWWHEKQIDDEDFVAGIEYLINEEIITIPDTQLTDTTAQEIPQWISNVAGFWSSNQITDDEFIHAMQWLISNGVMKVV